MDSHPYSDPLGARMAGPTQKQASAHSLAGTLRRTRHSPRRGREGHKLKSLDRLADGTGEGVQTGLGWPTPVSAWLPLRRSPERLRADHPDLRAVRQRVDDRLGHPERRFALRLSSRSVTNYGCEPPPDGRGCQAEECPPSRVTGRRPRYTRRRCRSRAGLGCRGPALVDSVIPTL